MLGDPIAITKAGAQIVQQAGIMGSGVTWSTVFLAVITALLAPAVVAFIKIYPRLKEESNKRAGSLDDDRREDMRDMRAEITAMKADLKDCHHQISEERRERQLAENKLVAAVSAIALLTAEVKRLDPGNTSPVLDQVQQLLAAATAGDFGLGKGMEKLAQLR